MSVSIMKTSTQILVIVSSRPCLDGIANQAKQQNNWRLRFCRPQDPRIPALLDNPQLAGAIVSTRKQDIRSLLQTGLPIVSLINERLNNELPSIMFDEHAIGELAAEHLLQRGLQVLHWCGTSHEFSKKREAGFRDYAERHGARVISKRWSWMSGTVDRIGEWLNSQSKPLGIAACSDSMVDLVYAALEERGIAVPDQAALVGVDNNELVCELSQQSISSVDRNEEGIGEAAVRLLAKILNGSAGQNESIYVPPRFVVERRSSQMTCLTDPDLRKAIDYIKENAHKPIDVHNLLQITKLPRSSFFRKCREHFKSTPAQLIRKQRLEIVRHLLLDTELTLTEIALRSGFATAAHLGRCFKQAYQQSPGAFRQA